MHHGSSAQRAKTRARQRTHARGNLAQLPLELTAGDIVHDHTDDAPFEPPPIDDIFGLEEIEDEETEFVASEENAPFDPPEFDEEPVFTAPASLAAPVVQHPTPPALEPPALPARRDRPLPAISVYASWDRPEAETLMRQLSNDPRFARADMRIARGGVDGALSCDGEVELFILDTTLENAALIRSLHALRAFAPQAQIVVLGSVNDIALLRDLSAVGVSDYFVFPASADAVAGSVCALFAETGTARTLAVIGARGGIGSSTIARNVAWSIAERQQKRVSLVDLDLSFGNAGAPGRSAIDVLDAADVDAALADALQKVTPRLHVLPAPAKTAELEIDADAFNELISCVRRTSSYAVLDLPHAWEPWVRDALRYADEVVIVAGPDLASLRNTDNILKLLRSERDKPSAPVVVLSMCGVPKRPEIPLKDFADSLRAKPALSFAFEPELFANAEAAGVTIYEAMPDAKAALQIDTLASLLTGHEPMAQPEARLALTTAAEVVEKISQPAVQTRRKRKPGRSGYVSLQAPARCAPTQRRGLVRACAAAIALMAVGAWCVGQLREDMRTALPEAAQANSA